jgi:NDP-sugar pyrophosphorylase family protein
MQAVILAGGKGTRLHPLTITIPKPLVPIDDLPILEIVLRQLKHYGFTDIILSVGHLANLIMAFFGNGGKFGLNIRYSLEDIALGTAGPLTLINNLDENFLVMNGDLLTTIDFRARARSSCHNGENPSPWDPWIHRKALSRIHHEAQLAR